MLDVLKNSVEVWKWDCSGKSKVFDSVTADKQKIYQELLNLDDDPNLLGYNFHYVTNSQHFASMGLLEDDVDERVLKQPAHFNPQFYFVKTPGIEDLFSV